MNSSQVTGSPASIFSNPRLKQAGLVLAVFLLLLAIGLGIKSLMGGHSSTKKTVTTIKLLPDTPPPPPPPPPTPKEPPKEQPKEMKMEQPKPQEAPQPPAPEALKMEGAAGDGPSPFGAGQVNNDYKGGEVGTKIGGSGNAMSLYAWYTSQITAKIQESLTADKTLAKAKYRLEILLWLTRDGLVDHLELRGTSGNRENDDLIKKILTAMPPMREPPPEEMPQPVRLRISN